VRAAQRRAEQQVRRNVSQINQKLQAEARRVDQHNQQAIARYNSHVDAVNRHNQQVDRHNQQVVSRLNQQLVAASRPRTVKYTIEERQLVDRVQEAAALQEDRDYDVFLSYARIDGAATAQHLREELEVLGVAVWFDEVAIRPGKSQALQMDQGLRRARAGVVVLTAAYLAGRFWTERELGALLHKPTLIPVLHGVTFKDVKEYSGILPDLAGFATDRDNVKDIAVKIASAVLKPAA
jgi:hypothetical protein